MNKKYIVHIYNKSAFAYATFHIISVEIIFLVMCMKYLSFLSRKKIITLSVLIVIIFAIAAAYPGYQSIFNYLSNEEEIKAVLEDYFRQRGAALISGDPCYIEGQFDTSTTHGKWSYEHELTRIKYIKAWSDARGVTFKECEPRLKIFSFRGGTGSARIYMSVLTRFVYAYNTTPDILNEFCLGTKHTINMANKDGIWYITTDWYSDPLEDSGVAGVYEEPDTIEVIEAQAYNYARTRYNRAKAVEYADLYCGALWSKADGYKYNTKYRNYADLGGDCANFASQVLSDKNAGGLKMDGAWLYKKGSASKAWVNAEAFTRHMLYSGRARLVSRGKYNKVVNFTKYIGPGDIVSYEKKGDIVHVSIVTAIDSNGVPLVNSHTNDRYHVPWDLGWGSKEVSFWFLRIND